MHMNCFCTRVFAYFASSLLCVNTVQNVFVNVFVCVEEKHNERKKKQSFEKSCF